MKKEFVCKKCRHHFFVDTEDNESVVCPKCLSEEVEPFKGNGTKKGIFWTVVGVLVVLLALGAMKLFKPGEKTLELSITDRTISENGYDFNASCNLDDVVFELLDIDKDVVQITNLDGVFRGVRPSESGSYRLHVYNAKNEKTVTLNGFDRLESNTPVEDIGGIEDPIAPTVTPVLTTTTPKVQSDKTHYSMDVECNVEVSKYELIGLNDDKVVASSNDGHFKNVAPAPADSYNSYRVRAILKDGTVTAPKQVSGFEHIEVVKVPAPTVAEVQKDLLSDKTILGNNPKIAQNVKLHFKNIKSGETAPSLIADIQNKIDMGMWDHVTVTEVKANDNGKVTEIFMTIAY